MTETTANSAAKQAEEKRIEEEKRELTRRTHEIFAEWIKNRMSTQYPDGIL